MRKFVAKYYPIIKGKETEYTTTVIAKDAASAEVIVRNALAEQLQTMANIAVSTNAVVVDYNLADLPKDIEYAKNKMRVVIQ